MREAISGVAMAQMFAAVEASGASDLHLKVGCTPGLRVDGALLALEGTPALHAADLQRLAAELATPAQLAALETVGDVEFACVDGERARYRVSLVRESGTIGGVLRRIPLEIQDLAKLGLPAVVKRLATLSRGLVLVTGPAGSGKSTTLAAMIDHRNRESGGHILTIEEPIEHVHRDQRCFITQREVGTDCPSYAQALRRAAHHDPDVIVIGELRDHETASLALRAAETGHLVLATMPMDGAVPSIDHFLDAFPNDQRGDERARLASCLQGVVSQTLVPRPAGGRVAALEILVVTESIRGCIRDAKPQQLTSQIQTGGAHGMQTQSTALADLVRSGAITEEVAIGVARQVDELRHEIASGGSHLRSVRPGGAAAPRHPSATAPVEPLAAGPAPVAATVAATSAPATPSVASPATTAQQQLLERLRRA